MHHATNRTLPLVLLGGLVLCVQPAFAEEERTAWRLFIADHTDPTITVLDLDNPDTRWTFETTGPSRLYASDSGEAVVAVQSDHDTVAFLSSGVSMDAHGHHADIDVEAPALLDAVLTGPRPFHVVVHHDTVSINFDRGGYAFMIDEAAILDGSLDDGTAFPQNRAHHGFATPFGGQVVSSVASEEPIADDASAPRVGIQAFEADGTPHGEMQVCTDLHGEALSGGFLLAGCAEGVVAAHASDDDIVFEMLTYPPELPEGHTGTLLGAAAMQIFLGNYGADAVVVIDPTTAPYFTHVALPFRRVDFVLDPARPQFAYVLTEDGTLHRLNLLTATIEHSVSVTQPYSMDGHWRDPRPRLAMAGGDVVLTDPLASVVRLVDADSLEESATIAIEGLPYNIVAVGGSGLDH